MANDVVSPERAESPLSLPPLDVARDSLPPLSPPNVTAKDGVWLNSAFAAKAVRITGGAGGSRFNGASDTGHADAVGEGP